MTLLATLCGFIVFRWASKMYGAGSGLFALGLFAFSPNVLAHGMLVTTDVPVGAFMVLALYLFWTTIERPSLMRNVAVGLATGAAMSSKFSGAILPILLIVFCAARVFTARDRRKQAMAEIQISGDRRSLCAMRD